jgi:hypothetical protein
MFSKNRFDLGIIYPIDEETVKLLEKDEKEDQLF